MTWIPRNDPVPVVVRKSEKLTARLKSEGKRVKPAEISDKTDCSEYLYGLIEERRNVGRKLILLQKDKRSQNIAVGGDEHASKAVPNADILKSETTTIGDWVKKHPRDRQFLQAVDPGTKLVKHLQADPDLGKVLGEKALSIRRDAQIENLLLLKHELDDLLKDRKALGGKYKVGTRMMATFNDCRYPIGWFAKDHKFLGAVSTVALGILVKISLLLIFVDLIEGGHHNGDKHHKHHHANDANGPTVPGSNIPVSAVMPGPTSPTPLTTALNMPAM